MKTLNALKKGQSATIIAIHGAKSALRRRLLDMGLTPHAKVLLTRTAPFGDPIELTVRGYSLIIRREDALLVEVE